MQRSTNRAWGTSCLGLCTCDEPSAVLHLCAPTLSDKAGTASKRKSTITLHIDAAQHEPCLGHFLPGVVHL